ncbi:MAG: RtcB family protein [Candidatus Thermoplasmatota archaeon]|jgi:tRNA-splicing ligase RtcB|nr:RtcB family protein [Candidatus Thermoplasmatota archaeon]
MKITSLRNAVAEISDGRRSAVMIGTESIMNQAMSTNAVEQLLNISLLPGIRGKPVGLPDLHPGYGFPIGSVAAFDAEDGIVMPGGVGYDINCGVSLLSTGLPLNIFLRRRKEFMDDAWKRVPVGMARSRFKPSYDDLYEIVEGGLKWAYSEGFCDEHDMRVTEHSGSMYAAGRENISEKAFRRGENYLGTLGSGNHFIEMQHADHIFMKDIADDFLVSGGSVYIMIHTGSRGLGHQVATDYMEEVETRVKDEDVPDRQLKYAPVRSSTGERYISAMNGAANYGFVNRQMIVHNLRESLRHVYGGDFTEEDSFLVYSISHNIATFEDIHLDGRRIRALVHRKGATSAFGPSSASGHFAGIGNPVLIPGSMGTSSYVMVGKDGNEDISISSSCHGAGRIMSRKRARDEISPSDVRENLRGRNIEALSGSEFAMSEESPDTYKDIDQVILSSELSGIGLKVASLSPVGVIKG